MKKMFIAIFRTSPLTLFNHANVIGSHEIDISLIRKLPTPATNSITQQGACIEFFEIKFTFTFAQCNLI